MSEIDQNDGAETYEDELLDLAEDPKRIETREKAEEIIRLLDHKIAGIQAQLDVAAIEAGMRPLSPTKQTWVRKASYAKSMMINHRYRVQQRDKALRRGGHDPLAKRDPAVVEAKRLKQERLMAEAGARRIAKQAKAEAARTAQMQFSEQRREREAKQRFEHRFHLAAKQLLRRDQFDEVVRLANRGIADLAQGIEAGTGETPLGGSTAKPREPGPAKQDAPISSPPLSSQGA